MNDSDSGCWPIGASAALIAQAPTLLDENAKLREALTEMLALVESGHLVRNVSGDGKPDWALKQVGLVKTLVKAQALCAQEAQP